MVDNNENHDNNNTARNPYQNEVQLKTITLDNGRIVEYCIAGNPKGTPVLVFYPGGGNRRLLATMHDVGILASLYLICINRPGKGGTSTTTSSSADAGNNNNKSTDSASAPKHHVSTVCTDAIHVLDFNNINRVGLLFICAGTPFALAFAIKYPHRVFNPIIGICSWVMPADCMFTSCIKRFGASDYIPIWFVSTFVGNVMSSMNSSMACSITSLPNSIALQSLKAQVSNNEYNAIFDRYSEQEFIDRSLWMFEEKYGEKYDIGVLFSKSNDIGLDYNRIANDVILFHGDEDPMVPIAAAEWLVEQIPLAQLKRISGGTHDGLTFLMNTDPFLTVLKSYGSGSVSSKAKQN